jgi:hypothetical protein
MMVCPKKNAPSVEWFLITMNLLKFTLRESLPRYIAFCNFEWLCCDSLYNKMRGIVTDVVEMMPSWTWRLQNPLYCGRDCGTQFKTMTTMILLFARNFQAIFTSE